MSEETEKDPETSDAVKFATLQGWTDKEAFKGNPDNWKTAEQFIEDGNKHAVILRERNQKLAAQVSEMQSTMTQLVDDQQKQKDKAVKRAIKELRVQKVEAINESDGEKVTAIDEQIDQLKEDAKPAPNPTNDFDRWITDNAWYNTDPMLKAEANMYAKAYVDAGSFKTDAEVFDAVTRRIKREFPDQFENPNKKEPSSVAPGSHSKPSGAAGKKYSDLPAEAKAACDRFVKTIPKFTVDKYLATYEWD